MSHDQNSYTERICFVVHIIVCGNTEYLELLWVSIQNPKPAGLPQDIWLLNNSHNKIMFCSKSFCLCINIKTCLFVSLTENHVCNQTILQGFSINNKFHLPFIFQNIALVNKICCHDNIFNP